MKLILCLFLLLSSSISLAQEKVFRLHLSNEPGGLDPHKQRTSTSSYLLGNLYRNIYTFDDQKGLVPDLGSCKKEKKKFLICTLKKDLQWSDGTPLTAADFLRSYLRILDPKTGSPRADLLFPIKNAQQIYEGTAQKESFGVTVTTPTTFKIEFTDEAGKFEHDLANFLTAPVSPDLKSYSGPYKLKEWQKAQKIVLEKNPHYHAGHKDRPHLEFLFIEEDTVALQLYEKNQLQFLRRLPTLFIPQFKSRKDFHWVPVIRFDYIGFGPELKDQEELRKAFTYSLNYVELQKIFSSEGRPGCIGLPNSWFPTKAPCFDFDLKKVPKTQSTKTYTMMFSGLGGEDHKRATEWLQDQWKKNAGLKTHLELKENKIYLQTLRSSPPPLFRKGGAPDRPTCYSALQTFSEKSGENFIGLKSPVYEKVLSQLAKAKNETEKKRLCLEGINHLMNNHLLIPLGAIQFSILVKTDWAGWKLNQLNQLDLSELHFQP
ncbi:peptide ABC transporter [Bdellovibrio bacteriovorus]|uniref:Peptide ABC transporter n=1 Tax=Bdellovibrio bacteriovorus TaxID=959 RepID=A0A150WK47_BDEBC|nr:peptide ABC transporter substrate-binding protein [Bdellovibrio bacteriovorus]KYG63955.1 peptide ABC transporter [Bdellovibrio bacteriovorus]